MFRKLFEIETVEFADKDMQEAYYRGRVDGRTQEQIYGAIGIIATGLFSAACYLFMGHRQTKMNRELNAAIDEEGKLGESMFLQDQNDILREQLGDD
jgi:hypothetical protein|uniref:Uncharacterized protein n=1 Tax=Siphoviridae sp. ctuBK6 TaxID=2827963 RepID=A0A8S5THF9_9CAUD|nr:MAG TPA: hypothetical protein [Siphoviridae sp. ctuBK6]DAQ32786.1 MAG TPA: hypothetical protein [Caudoviricetes sp.]DAS81683.1 MAG TPA: hypothetical protein [Caudoviricetes sp.]DAW73369.1 MAG TPA: hypothetical protein [Caudoviricetes sp.]